MRDAEDQEFLERFKKYEPKNYKDLHAYRHEEFFGIPDFREINKTFKLSTSNLYGFSVMKIHSLENY